MSIQQKLLDLDEVHTDLLPAERCCVNDYCNKKTKGRMVLLVGDGINDASALQELMLNSHGRF